MRLPLALAYPDSRPSANTCHELTLTLDCGVDFFVSIIPMGVLISWICMKNGRSVIATIVFHFIVNMAQEALAMTQTTKCIETGVLTLIAAGIVMADRQAIRAGDEVVFGRPLAQTA